MCTSPILIRNKKFQSLGVNVPSSYIKVPCGHCDECLRKRAKDLYIRVRFEAEDCILHGGVGFMCTLTYDNTNVPILVYEGRKYMVFNKTDVQLFLKRLRTTLDRTFRSLYGVDAPDFKYLITSEYGINPNASHRPHYHLIILFPKYISLYIFRKCFESALVNHKTKERYFGKIFQCDVLDIKRGGIKYSAKYILKDQAFEKTNIIIRKLINFYTDYVVQKHSIKTSVTCADDAFYNKCIRSTKAYKKDISTYVSKYRHCLQFYMCSNDLGTSSILRRYGDSLLSFGKLDVEGFPYSIPKAVLQKIERVQGSVAKHTISKSVFLSSLDLALSDCVMNHVIDSQLSESIKNFASDFLQPLYGSLYFINNGDFTYYSSLFKSPLRDYDTMIQENSYYQDNDFFFYRDMVVRCINYYNRKENLDFRAHVAHRKTTDEENTYKTKKYNQVKIY